MSHANHGSSSSMHAQPAVAPTSLAPTPALLLCRSFSLRLRASRSRFQWSRPRSQRRRKGRERSLLCGRCVHQTNFLLSIFRGASKKGGRERTGGRGFLSRESRYDGGESFIHQKKAAETFLPVPPSLSLSPFPPPLLLVCELMVCLSLPILFPRVFAMHSHSDTAQRRRRRKRRIKGERDETKANEGRSKGWERHHFLENCCPPPSLSLPLFLLFALPLSGHASQNFSLQQRTPRWKGANAKRAALS